MMVLRMAYRNYRPRCQTCQVVGRVHHCPSAHCPSGDSQAVLFALLKQNKHQYQTLTHYVYFKDALFYFLSVPGKFKLYVSFKAHVASYKLLHLLESYV
jgi:hypothetical protein